MCVCVLFFLSIGVYFTHANNWRRHDDNHHRHQMESSADKFSLLTDEPVCVCACMWMCVYASTTGLTIILLALIMCVQQ